ncbi:MAG: PAS domain-containing protein, partial [Rhodoferax sp.]|nr:PAS domain-containing protein [Rhodoferax sp.]
PARAAQTVTRADVMQAAGKLFVDPPLEFARIERILASDEPHTDRLELRDGRVLERNSVPMKNASGPTRVWIFRDITVQEQAVEALRANDGQQRALMDAFPGYVSVIDQDFVYTYVNARMAALFDLQPAEIIGRRVRDLMGEEQYRQNVREIARVRAGQRVAVEQRFEATERRPEVYLQV